MKKIAVFCIPAHGHTNPMLPVVRELAARGDEVRFYSFSEFQEKIEQTGAAFVGCDRFLPELTVREAENLKKVSATEMTLQDIRITAAMDTFLHDEFTSFRPDVVYTDSVCFWGKLNAWKYDVPMVVSTSTFAFNQMSSTYMKNTPGEMARMLSVIGKTRANIINIRHDRNSIVNTCFVTTELETRDSHHIEELISALSKHGYTVLNKS